MYTPIKIQWDVLVAIECFNYSTNIGNQWICVSVTEHRAFKLIPHECLKHEQPINTHICLCIYTHIYIMIHILYYAVAYMKCISVNAEIL